MNTYTKVKKLLTMFPECRNSDKELLWLFWSMDILKWKKPYFKLGNFCYGDLKLLTPAESITRARRAVQKSNPDLKASKPVQEARKAKMKQLDWLF